MSNETYIDISKQSKAYTLKFLFNSNESAEKCISHFFGQTSGNESTLS